jgi:hypothetical protein
MAAMATPISTPAAVRAEAGTLRRQATHSASSDAPTARAMDVSQSGTS